MTVGIHIASPGIQYFGTGTVGIIYIFFLVCQIRPLYVATPTQNFGNTWLFVGWGEEEGGGS